MLKKQMVSCFKDVDLEKCKHCKVTTTPSLFQGYYTIIHYGKQINYKTSKVEKTVVNQMIEMNLPGGK